LFETNYDFHCIHNDTTDIKWLKHWDQVWPYCKNWYLSEGLLRRPGYLTCLSAVRSFMPEIEPVYSSLLKATGGNDIAGRFLSLYNPPPYLAGCSQAVWDKQEDLFLMKNYDYSLSMFERTLLYSNWLKPVIGILDCAWGLLDGINGDGLVASLTFGGRKEVGEGFGAPIILRYILETSTSVEDAKIRISQIPCHMSYNITLLDATGAFTKVYLGPGHPAIFVDDPVSTNHQDRIDWLEYIEFSKTIERYTLLKKTLLTSDITVEEFTQLFFKKPFFNVNFKQQFGTLYTAAYRPQNKSLTLLWQQNSVVQSFEDFNETELNISIKDVSL